MNLVPTGKLRPTSDAHGVHEPLTLYFEGHPVRFIIRNGLPFDQAPAWVLADVARALGFKEPHRAGRSFLQGEDKGGNRILTLGGPQEMTVLSYTGLTKLLMRSDKETARRFQDWLAAKSSDLTFYGVAFRDVDAASANYVTRDELASLLGPITQAVANQGEAIANLTQTLANLSRTGRRTRTFAGGELPEWSLAEHHRLRKLGFQTAGEFLISEHGSRPKFGAPGGLTARTQAYCEAHGLKPERRYRAGAVLVYLPEAALKVVYRKDWRARTALMAEAEARLFESLPLATG